MVPTDSQQISRARCYSGIRIDSHRVFVYGILTLYDGPFQTTSTNTGDFSLSAGAAAPTHRTPQPRTHNPCRVSHVPGLASSAFARHYSRNHMLFSLPVGTEMFHFPTFPPHALYIQARVTRHHSCWVSPFGNPRITARLTAPRGISQPPTSFIGSWCQGIHRTLINTYNKDARVHCAVLKQHTTPTTHPTDRQKL